MSMDSYEQFLKESTASLQSELQKRDCSCTVECGITRVTGFVDSDVVTFISFTLGAIAASILSEIGKELWDKIKDVYSGIVAQQKTLDYNHRIRIVLIVRMRSAEIQHIAELDGCQDALLKAFWEAIPDAIKETIAMSESAAEDIRRPVIKTFHGGEREDEWFWDVSEGGNGLDR